MTFDIKTFPVTRENISQPKKTDSQRDKVSVEFNDSTQARDPALTSTIQNDSREITAAMEKVRELAKGLNRNLQFSIDRDTGKTVVKIVDAENGDVVRQIPSEDFLALSKSLSDIKGMLLHAQA